MLARRKLPSHDANPAGEDGHRLGPPTRDLSERRRKAHPPIYIGASSEWAIRRVADFADGWLPAMGTCDLDERMGQLRRFCDENGRDVSEIDVSVFGGPVDKAVLEALAKQGVRRLITVVPSQSESEVLAVLDQQASLVEWASELE